MSLLWNRTSDLYSLANLVDSIVLPFSCHTQVAIYDSLSCYVSCRIASNKLILGEFRDLVLVHIFPSLALAELHLLN